MNKLKKHFEDHSELYVFGVSTLIGVVAAVAIQAKYSAVNSAKYAQLIDNRISVDNTAKNAYIKMLETTVLAYANAVPATD